MRERSALRQDGVEAQGRITFLDRVGRGGYVIRYTFTTGGGEVSNKAEVPPRLVTNLQGSAATTIRYLPSNPAINHPTAWEWSLLSEWPAIFVLMGLLAVGVVISAVFFRRRYLIVWGKPAPGVVTNCREGGRGSISVEYEFRTETGVLMKGSGNSLIRQQIGTRVWILYLPQDPGRNLAYPVPDYIVGQ
jgi:hypothetical protein